MMKRRSFLLLGGALGLMPAAARANAPRVSLRPKLRPGPISPSANGGLKGLLARAGLSGKIVCAVADVKSGLRLEAEGGQTALPPASVAKALTALYALDTFGADHRFRTELVASGTVIGGVLKGDLILVGGGDSMLNTDHLAQLARSLKSAGVREVRGAFRVYDGALPRIQSIDPGQPDHVGYSPAISGIALNFNRVHFEWKPAGGSWNVTMDARTEKYRPGVSMARMRVENRSTPVYTYADRGGVDQWSVARAALGKGGARWLPVRRPAAYAGDVFRTMARSHGIALPAAKESSKRPEGQVLAVHTSPPLSVMLKAMLRYSNNLMAEMIGMAASRARGHQVQSLAQSGAAMSQWAATTYGMRTSKLVDHSGLGPQSRMTPDDLVSALIAAHKDGRLKPLLKAFPLRDANGRNVKNHPVKVAAKTGTLNFVSGLGGFMTARDGTELAFAIFTADQNARARISRAERERPQGARGWNRKSKQLQQQLIERWDAVYGR